MKTDFWDNVKWGVIFLVIILAGFTLAALLLFSGAMVKEWLSDWGFSLGWQLLAMLVAIVVLAIVTQRALEQMFFLFMPFPDDDEE